MKEFPVCPRCASIRLRMPGIRDGTVYYWQNLSEYACEDCELRAVPLWFDDLESFEAFRADKQAGGSGKGSEVDEATNP